jgi:hypothetical protein
VEEAQSRPKRPTTGTSASHKLEMRRLQVLTKQRERLEQELNTLTSEVNALVGRLFSQEPTIKLYFRSRNNIQH